MVLRKARGPRRSGLALTTCRCPFPRRTERYPNPTQPSEGHDQQEVGRLPTGVMPSGKFGAGTNRSVSANAPLRTSSTSFAVNTAPSARMVSSPTESSSAAPGSSTPITTSPGVVGVPSKKVKETSARDTLVASSTTAEASCCD